MNLTTVDLERQRVKLSEFVGLGAEVWLQDATIKALAANGIFDCHFGDTPPSNTRKLWLHYAMPATGARGTLKRYNPSSDMWIPMTALEFTTYLNVSARPNIYFQATTPVDPQRGDYWWHTDEDGIVSLYMPTGTGTSAWIDFNGGALDQGTLAQVSVTYSNGASPHANPKFGDWWTSPSNSHEYLYTRAGVWRDMNTA